MIISNISWERFEMINPDRKLAFERMCRILFNYQFFNNRAILQASPNNPGVEIEPILNPSDGKRISFQSKYFDNCISYEQIKSSVLKLIKVYLGQIDIIYLYCNKDLTLTCASYLDIVKELKINGIEIVPITNLAILDFVISEKVDVVSSLFFNNPVIDEKWFKEQLSISLFDLEPRYNKNFNVRTNLEQQLELFYITEEAIKTLNGKKQRAIEQLKDLRKSLPDYQDLFDEIIKAIGTIKDVNINNSLEFNSWKGFVEESVSIHIKEFRDEYEHITQVLYGDKRHDKEYSKDKINQLNSKRILMSQFEDCLDILEFGEIENQLQRNKVLVIEGEAGSGKSHLLGNIASKYSDRGEYTILLLGQKFLTTLSIEEQIISQLNIDYSFDVLLNVLEGFGIIENKNVVIMIDAINESLSKDIWKTGLVSFMRKINSCSHVKLILSIRTTYGNLIFSEAIKDLIQRKEVTRLTHTGFQENQYEAMMVFFDYYRITFSPADFLYYELTNPLMLTMYCKTHQQKPDNLYSLFDYFVNDIDEKIKRDLSIEYSGSTLKELLTEIAEIYVCCNTEHISKRDLFKLSFWNTFGIQDKKLNYVNGIEKNGLLSGFVDSDGNEILYFAYQKLTDYYSARFILGAYKTDEELRNFVKTKLLEIEKGEIRNRQKIDVFNILCSIYPEEFKGELIDVVNHIDSWEAREIKKQYMALYSWRKPSTIDINVFLSFVKENSYDDVLQEMIKVFINCSTRISHQLNANGLHDFLYRLKLNSRDRVWTIYINGLDQESERIWHLVELFQKGDIPSEISKEQIKLLLILLCWTLSSTNRCLRDRVSESIIEILKFNFSLCKELIEMFEGVNDPYVVQRLYGIVFGACLKRTNVFENEYRELVECVYGYVFNREKVYPDILLRDYARNIIERYIYEFPKHKLSFSVKKIRPPYASDAIPKVVKMEYYSKEDAARGFNSIEMSMRTTHTGMYGDFGRYVFQAALDEFENVDVENAYHYAMKFIKNELGYTNDYFSEYDSRGHGHFRYDDKKIERIGKKYQWIAFYNILARTADHHRVESEWNKYVRYSGPWNPYVRDFDPTLNNNFLTNPNVPQFRNYGVKIKTWDDKETLTAVDATRWAEKDEDFFSKHSDKLLFEDELGREWYLLYERTEYKNRDDIFSWHEMRNGSKMIWSLSRSYIVHNGEYSRMIDKLSKISLDNHRMPEGSQPYTIFNREYPWAPCVNDIFSNYWDDITVPTGEKKIITGRSKQPEFDDTGFHFVVKPYTRTELIEENIGKAMPTFIHFLWEEGYDASQDEAVSFTMPCVDMIKKLQLRQKAYDGYYYNADDELIAFDTKLTSLDLGGITTKGLLIRKDAMLRYLGENDLSLFWTCIGEKQSWLDDMQQFWSKWKGLCTIQDGKIVGCMKKLNENED